MDIDNVVKADVCVEFYLKGRENSVPVFTSFEVPRGMLTEGHELEDFVEHAELSILALIDTKGELRIVLPARRENRYIVMIDEIQAISLSAPDPESLAKAMRGD